MSAHLGIAGLDENLRLRQSHSALGIVTEGRGNQLAGAKFGMAGLNCKQITRAGEQACFGISGLDRPAKTAMVGVAGPNRHKIIHSANAAMGIAGNMGNGRRVEMYDQVVDVGAFRRRDEALSAIALDSKRLGDRAAREAWRYGVWFADYTYVVTLGKYKRVKRLTWWRDGREQVFGREHRALPVFLDSCGYRRELTGTAPKWAHDFETYPSAIDLVNPDGYAWYDFPKDQAKTMMYGKALMGLYPDDVTNGRQWPVYSVRWRYDPRYEARVAGIPGWPSTRLANLIPVNRTQRPFKEETREAWARNAIANALIVAKDPLFRWMVESFGRVMLGGMVRGPIPRMARHIYLAVLCHLFPDAQFWALGQANFAVVNGLGVMGLLNRVWLDGSWWIKDATADRFAVLENGLITMLSLEGWAQSFITLVEAMAANLRSLLAAYAGLWEWPPPEPLPTDMFDLDQVVEMKARLHAAQMELGL